MDKVEISANSIPDAWFQLIYAIVEKGRKVRIDRGSYEGQYRIEFDYASVYIDKPFIGSETPEILPQIPVHMNIPDPVEFSYIYGGEGVDRPYVNYIMTADTQPKESYTYGSRLTRCRITDNSVTNSYTDDSIISSDATGRYLNQVEYACHVYKQFGHRNNQIILQVASPSDMLLTDPPCLRHIDTRIQDGKLNFYIYFRSWDLWGGFPANLAGIEYLQKYMAMQIGVEQGYFMAESKGLHIYGYAEELAKIRSGKA